MEARVRLYKNCIQFVYNSAVFPCTSGPVVYKLYTTGLPGVYNCIQFVYNWPAGSIQSYTIWPPPGAAHVRFRARSPVSRFLHTILYARKKDESYTNCIRIVYNRGCAFVELYTNCIRFFDPLFWGVRIVYNLYTTRIRLHKNHCAS